MIKIGGVEPSAIMVGDSAVSAVYRGAELVWIHSILPDGYTRLANIESSGHQYIETGISADDTLKIESECTNGNAVTTRYYPFGVAAEKERIQVNIRISGQPVFWGWGGSFSQQYDKYFTSHEIVRLELSSDAFYVDGILVYKPINHTFPQHLKIPVFAIRTASGISNLSSIIMRSLKISNGTEALRDFVPALDSLGRPCLYDVVSKKPFYNQGTGEFGYELADGTRVAPV